MSTADVPPFRPFPLGVWVRIDIPQLPNFVGFTYVDAEAGPSARGASADDPSLAEVPATVVRLSGQGFPCTALPDEERVRLNLPEMPPWLLHYGQQPPRGMSWGSWRDHPKLRGRLHPEYPDDLQVLVHDGGPRLTDHQPELIWVSITGADADVFTGRVLNQPHQLTSVSQGSTIRFIVPDGGEHPLMVTEKYLRERSGWTIQPCNRCGLSELFDAPSDLVRVVFPALPPEAVMSAFTAFCGACGGVLVLQPREGSETLPPPSPASQPETTGKKWWQFWK